VETQILMREHDVMKHRSASLDSDFIVTSRHPGVDRGLDVRQVIAAHAVLEGRHQRRVAPGHRKKPSIPHNGAAQEPGLRGRAGDVVARRSFAFYDAVARRLAVDGGRP
jgi:hypothetical protein